MLLINFIIFIYHLIVHNRIKETLYSRIILSYVVKNIKISYIMNLRLLRKGLKMGCLERMMKFWEKHFSTYRALQEHLLFVEKPKFSYQNCFSVTKYLFLPRLTCARYENTITIKKTLR